VSNQVPALKHRVLAELRRKAGMKAAALHELVEARRRGVKCWAYSAKGAA